MPVTANIIPIHHIRSDKDTHFTGALVQYAAENENLAFPSGLVGCGECVIEAIIIQSDQNLDWYVYIFGSDGFDDTDLDADYFIEYVAFATTTGLQIAAANQYYYSSTNLNIPYKDRDWDDSATTAAELHIALVNRNATAKNAGATGEIVLDFIIRPVAFT
jgi:hypothetical protein